MKARFLVTLAALLGAVTIAKADFQLNAGGIYANGDGGDSFGFEAGVGGYFKHSTTALSSALTLNYLGISTLEENGESVDVEAGYDMFALDYKLYFPIVGDGVVDLFVEGLAGGVNTKVDAKFDDLELDADEWGFGWGVGGGVQWNITQNFGLGLGYTFLGLDEPAENGIAVGQDSLHLIRLNALLRF